MIFEDMEYVGFWTRVGAALIDSVLVLLICAPIVTAIYGPAYWNGEKFVQGWLDFIVSWVLPAAAAVVFWKAKQATPGKMAFSARIVDEKTGEAPTTGQLIGRYLGYYVSTIPLFLGILWVGIDPRKQGWHDKLAGTVVIRPKKRDA
ncbi:MAG: RDD family protein [Gammaproteobacteria bacterium]|nr:RDD family protein [Gammaproteobacteria bacterium]